jgi:hypothetical protein
MQKIKVPKKEKLDSADKIIKAMKVTSDPRQEEESFIDKQEMQVDLLKQMRSGVHTKFIIEHDGKEFPLRLISDQEQHDCFLNACRDFYALPEYMRIYTNILDRYNMIYVLDKALSSSPLCPGDGQIFMSLKALKTMTSASLSSLFAKYTAMDKQFSPCIDEMTDEEFEYLLEECVKKPALVRELSVLQLQRIALSYIQTLTKLMDK